jgi:hypothetical protein
MRRGRWINSIRSRASTGVELTIASTAPFHGCRRRPDLDGLPPRAERSIRRRTKHSRASRGLQVKTQHLRVALNSGLPDGATYTIRGHISGPQAALASGKADLITVYLFGYEAGEWNWDLKGVPGYDYAAEVARSGQVSLTLDELGYGASGHPANGTKPARAGRQTPSTRSSRSCATANTRFRTAPRSSSRKSSLRATTWAVRSPRSRPTPTRTSTG